MPVLIGLIIAAIVLRWAWNYISSTPWLMWSLAAAGGLFVLLAIWGLIEEHKQSKTPEGQRKIKEAAEKRRMMITPPEGFPAEPAFIGDHGRIALDPKERRLAIGNPNGWSVFDYEDVFGAELDVGEGQIIKTSSSRSLVGAVVGGAAFGAVGAIVGGTGGRTTSTTSKIVEHVVLRVQVRDMDNPVREVFFRINKFGLNADVAQRHGREWLARIQMIVDENES